jgi:hypothetical protein
LKPPTGSSAPDIRLVSGFTDQAGTVVVMTSTRLASLPDLLCFDTKATPGAVVAAAVSGDLSVLGAVALWEDNAGVHHTDRACSLTAAAQTVFPFLGPGCVDVVLERSACPADACQSGWGSVTVARRTASITAHIVSDLRWSSALLDEEAGVPAQCTSHQAAERLRAMHAHARGSYQAPAGFQYDVLATAQDQVRASLTELSSTIDRLVDREAAHVLTTAPAYAADARTATVSRYVQEVSGPQLSVALDRDALRSWRWMMPLSWEVWGRTATQPVVQVPFLVGVALLQQGAVPHGSGSSPTGHIAAVLLSDGWPATPDGLVELASAAATIASVSPRRVRQRGDMKGW